VIGPETARRIGDRLPLVPLETIHVKGKQEASAVHTLVPELADRPDALRELREIQGRLDTDEGNELLHRRAVELAPSLAHYYEKLGQRR
jgi:hypothetical protein